MKEQTYKVGGMRANINSGHTAFDAYCVSIRPGASIGGGVLGLGIRAYNTAKNPMHELVEPGDMMHADIRSFRNMGHPIPLKIVQAISDHGTTDDLMLYTFYHHKGGKRVDHGWILTYTSDRKNELIGTWVTGPTYKSNKVIEYAKDYVSNPRAA